LALLTSFFDYIDIFRSISCGRREQKTGASGERFVQRVFVSDKRDYNFDVWDMVQSDSLSDHVIYRKNKYIKRRSYVDEQSEKKPIILYDRSKTSDGVWDAERIPGTSYANAERLSQQRDTEIQTHVTSFFAR